MKKILLPTLAATAFLSAAPSYAQNSIYYDPFFDSMIFNPMRIESRNLIEPRMDVINLKDKIEVKAELPGMDEKDVRLTCENGVLTLSGERKTETEEQNKDYYLKETSSGSFSRSIRLPKNIDDSKIDAVFQKGILTITVPKTDVKEDTVKTIPIKSVE